MWNFKVTGEHGAVAVGRSHGRGARLVNAFCSRGVVVGDTAPWDLCPGVSWEMKAKTICPYP